jgi:halogenation protein CepH
VTESEEFDVVVVGGGPSGSTLAALVAKKGHRVLVLEKEHFPRYQIGESLLPSTVHGVCRLSGAADEIAKAGFTRKRGGTFRWGSKPEPWTFTFSVSERMAGPTSFAYQVERSKFDQILLDNARRTGAVVREGCSVSDVIVGAEERVTGVRYTDGAGVAHEVQAEFVVDASGNKSKLNKQLGGTRKYSEFFRSLALFGYFENGRRMPAPNAGNILCVAFDSGWFWYIPLSETLTSVGAVVRRELAEKVQGDPAQALQALIDECPMISDYLSSAQRVTEGDYGQVRVRKDYSYHHTAFWRPGMVLVGDAACFVDPVFSSGVHLATYSALLAARSINSILAGIVEEKQALNEFEARYRREYSVFYEFLVSFYEMHRDEDSYFWQAKKITQDSQPEFQSFVDLVAGVSSGESALTDVGTFTDRVLSQSEQFAAAVDGDAPGATSLMRAPVVQEAMREGSIVQLNAMLGEGAAEPESALFPGGLVASADGMCWVPGPDLESTEE